MFDNLIGTTHQVILPPHIYIYINLKNKSLVLF